MKTRKKNLKRFSRKKQIIYLFIPFVIFLFIFGCNSPRKVEEPSPDDNPILRVGVAKGVPHLLSIDKNGKLSGMEIELLEILAREKGYLLETTVYEDEELLFALRRGEIDIAVPCNTNTYIAANFLSPCAPHFKTGQRILVREAVAMFINNVSQLNKEDVILLTVAGTVSSGFAKKLFPEAKLISLKDIQSCLKKLIQEDGTVFLINSTDAWSLKTTGHNIIFPKNEKDKKPVKFVPVLSPLTDEEICWAVRRSNLDWQKLLNKFIEEQKKNGVLQELIEKYCVDDINK